MTYARTILNLCRQYHCLPSALLAEDVDLLRMMTLEAMGGGPDGQ